MEQLYYDMYMWKKLSCLYVAKGDAYKTREDHYKGG